MVVQEPTLDDTRLSQAFAEVLRVSSVSPDTGFFSAGGDSISAIRASSIAKQRGIVFSVQNIMKHQTAASLALVAQITNAGAMTTETWQGANLLALPAPENANIGIPLYSAPLRLPMAAVRKESISAAARRASTRVGSRRRFLKQSCQHELLAS